MASMLHPLQRAQRAQRESPERLFVPSHASNASLCLRGGGLFAPCQQGRASRCFAAPPCEGSPHTPHHVPLTHSPQQSSTAKALTEHIETLILTCLLYTSDAADDM
eukprot:2365954-Rhodomonas_salina.2